MKEENVIRETWGKYILESAPNFNFFFMHSSDKDFIDYGNHFIYTTSHDDYYGTGQKNLKSIKLLHDEGIEYDYILLTNTATIINIGLLNWFVNSKFIDNDKIYGGRLIFPVRHVPFFRGDFVLIHKSLIEEILKEYESYVNERTANDELVIKCLVKYRDSKGYDILNQLVEVNCIDDFADFDVNKINTCFYINTKIKTIERDNNEPVMSAMKLVWHLMSSYKGKICFDGLVRKPTQVQLNTGLYKLEYIRE